MRIGLDLRMVEGGSGIARYALELSQALLEQNKFEFVLFFNKLTPGLKEIYQKFGQKLVETGISHYSFSEQFKLPHLIRKEKVDLMHFPHFNVPIFYNKPFVVTIHDLTHTKFPGRKKSRFFFRLAYNAVLASAIKKSVAIIAVSKSTKMEILDLFCVFPEKISVIYEGINRNFKAMGKSEAKLQVNKFGIRKPYILYAGVFRRYKNLPNLVKAFDKLRESGFDLDLVLIGEEDPFYPEIKQQISSSRFFSDIKMPGKVSDEDLNYLYNAASLYVLPSLAEGFGLTVLEAAKAGIPVACSDIASLREVLGSAADYFDPLNVDNMKDVLANILSNPDRAEELSNLGKVRSDLFSWKKAAEETIKVYLGALHA